jgi:phosphatidylinositol alpha-1,6-mannosyltransferase
MSRTLFVTNDFPPRRGGIETFVRSLCDELPAAEVVVHAASMPGDLAHDRTVPFPVVRDPATTLLPTPAVAERVADTVRRFGCDIVVFGAAAPLGLLAPRLRSVGVRRLVAVTHGHEVWWATVPGTRRLLRVIGDSVDTVTYVSDYCGARIGRALSADAAARMVRLSPTVDASRFGGAGGSEVRRRHAIDPGAPVVVCVARLVRRKGQDTLLRIWPEVLERFPDAVLMLVGDGPDRARLERMADRRRLGAAVRFVGSVPWEAVPAHLGAADVFAMPCRTRRLGLEVEAFGIVFLEAAASGLPIVAGRSGGVADALRDAAGSTGRDGPTMSEGRHVLGRDGLTPRPAASASPQ